ncbi:hypothetical protein GCM10027176_31410 [Actinoallomurus bryophytorum]
MVVQYPCNDRNADGGQPLGVPPRQMRGPRSGGRAGMKVNVYCRRQPRSPTRVVPGISGAYKLAGPACCPVRDYAKMMPNGGLSPTTANTSASHSTCAEISCPSSVCP